MYKFLSAETKNPGSMCYKRLRNKDPVDYLEIEGKDVLCIDPSGGLQSTPTLYLSLLVPFAQQRNSVNGYFVAFLVVLGIPKNILST